MKFLIIGLTSLFLISCGGDDSITTNTKKDSNTANEMKLSKEIKNTNSNNNSNTNGNTKNNGIDARTTKTYKAKKVNSTTQTPMFDSGLRPTNSK
jgi:hypothetical protein